MSNNIRLTVTTDSLRVDPGESVETTVSIQNTSNVVDVFAVELDGLEESWYTLSSTSMSLFPGDSANVNLSIKVPRESTSVAQAYPFVVKVASHKSPADYITADCQVEVTPFYSFEADIRPQRASGARGSYTITLSNQGNSEMGFFLEGTDPEGLCHFTFEPTSPRVEPGSQVEVPLRVDPEQRPLRGPAKLYTLEIKATPSREVAEPATLRAELEATPKLPKWAIPVAIVSAVALVLIVVLAIVFWPSSPSFERTFALEPGQNLVLGLTLPEAVPSRIEVSANWNSEVDTLDVLLHRPDATTFPEEEISHADPSVRFLLDEESVSQGVSGWRISIRNPNNATSAEGTLIMNHATLN